MLISVIDFFFFCLLHGGAVIWSSVYCRMWLMKVSNLVQAKTRKDSSFDLVHVPTLSALDMPLLLQFPDRGESPWQLNQRKTCIDVIYLIPPPPPFSVYVLIILLLLLLFVVHQFAGLCSQQKQMGNICPGRPGPPPPGPPV